MNVRKRRGFTLVELLVVISIIGMLMALLLPAVQSAREAGRQTTCRNNLKNLGLALFQFEQQRGRYPGYNNIQAEHSDGVRARATGWFFPLLPFVEGATQYDAFKTDGEFVASAVGDLPAPTAQFNLMLCPSDSVTLRGQGLPSASYAANCGLRDSPPTDVIPGDWQSNGVFHRNYPYFNPLAVTAVVKTVKMSSGMIADGLGNTFLLSENVDSGDWTEFDEALVGFTWQASIDSNNQPNPAADSAGSAYPNEDPATIPDETLSPRLYRINEQFGFASATVNPANARPSSFHPGGVIAVFCDGRVQFIQETIDYLVYCLLMTPRGKSSLPAGTAGIDSSNNNLFFRDEDVLTTPAPQFEGRSVYAKSLLDDASFQTQ